MGDNVNTRRSNSESHAKAETASQALYPHGTNRPNTDVRKGTMRPRKEVYSFKVQNTSQVYSMQKLPQSQKKYLQPFLYHLLSESMPNSCSFKFPNAMFSPTKNKIFHLKSNSHLYTGLFLRKIVFCML